MADHFLVRDGVLHAEGVSLETIAAEVGTPTYVYSTATLLRHLRVFSGAFEGADALIAFSVKANSNVSVLATLAEAGAGADIVSGGELARALAAKVSPERIVFSGVGKTREELAAALKARIGLFNVESESELEALSEVAISLGLRAPIAIRVNPDVAAGGHANISTGKKEDKFGIAWDRAPAVYARAGALAGVEVVGVDVHIGSQIEALAPFQAAARRLVGLIEQLRSTGHDIRVADLGGGLAIPYRSDEPAPPAPDLYARALREIMDPAQVRYVMEPGRLIAGNAGILLSRVISVKKTETRTFLILDAGMNDLIRPALYEAWHDILPVREAVPDAPRAPVDVVGPICESTDVFAAQRRLPELNEGDLVVFKSAGAYGAAQSSQYNSRPLVAEVLVNGEKYALVRPRPTYDEMLAQERRAPWLDAMTHS